MLLSILDPALLIYDYDDWQNRAWHCFKRCEALTLHHQIIREYEQKLAMSDEFAALVIQAFPWNEDYKQISELRDLRQFMWQGFQKVVIIETQSAFDGSYRPEDVVCIGIDDPQVIDTWKELLHGCLDQEVLEMFEPQVSTWDSDSINDHSEITFVIDSIGEDNGFARDYVFPLVWDRDTWDIQLVAQEWWPNLHRCVELHFRTNPGIRAYPGIFQQPIPFRCTPRFNNCLDRYCRGKNLQSRFIEALTKRVYGVLDASLADEALGNVRRFRVTDYWRVHYLEEDNHVVLDEFGRHDIGGVG